MQQQVIQKKLIRQQFMRRQRERFQQLTRRERGMLAGASLLALGCLSYVPLELLWNEQAQLSAQIRNLSAKNILTDQQIELYEQKLALDPNVQQRQNLAELQLQLEGVDRALKNHNVVSAQEMASLLTNVLAQSTEISVLEFISLPVRALLDHKNPEKINLYRHGIQLTLAGDYFAVLNFLKHAESQPEKLYWHTMDYRVTDYPQAEVKLEFYTLSISEEFIRVAY